MNKKHKLTVGLVLAATLVSATALAGWSNPDSRLDAIEVKNTSTGSETYLGFATATTGKPACATNGWSILFGSVDGVKAMTVIANSALLAGRNVEVLFDSICTGSFARITSIRMR